MIDKLIKSVYRKDYNKIKELVDKGIDINGTDEDGRTALMHAVLSDDADQKIVNFLIDLGADVNIHDGAQKWTALHFAARDQKAKIVKTLLDRGAQVDAADAFGNTALWRCVMNISPSAETIEALLKKGADPEKKNNHGVSARDTAVKLGKEEIVKILDEETGS